MSTTTCSSPRPILKRAAHTTDNNGTTPRTNPRSPRDRGVHFPPSPKLTRTFTALSPTSYDRSPIVVSPNACALPERGCPGRTYVLSEADGPPSPTYGREGKCVHPRAAARSTNEHQNQNQGRHNAGLGLSLSGSGATNSHTDTLHDHRHRDHGTSTTTSPFTFFLPSAIPPLIPDLSSEESEESDGITSPPPPSISISTHHPNSNQPCSPLDRNALSFLPHPPSPDDKPRRRDRGSNNRKQPQFVVEDDEDVRHTLRYKSFSERSSLNSCALPDEDEGCLGGF